MSELPDPEALEQEAQRLMEDARNLRKSAALARVKLDDARYQVEVVKTATMPAYARAMDDPKLGPAAVAVESFAGEFTPTDLAVKLGFADSQRAKRLCRVLVEWEKIRETVDDDHYRLISTGEDALRDYIVENRTGTLEEAAAGAGVDLEEADVILGRFYAREIITFDAQGRWIYQEVEGGNQARLDRAPPERTTVPAYTEAVARGMPIRLVDHGKRAKSMSLPGQGHKQRLRDAAYKRQQEAREAAAAAAREKMTREMDKAKKRR